MGTLPAMQRGRKPKFTKEQLEHALRATHGQVCLAAQALGCSYRTVLRALQRHPDLDALCYELRTEVVERVENVLVEKALLGEPWAVQFLLKTWRREVYGDKVNIRHAHDPVPVEVQLNITADDRRALYEILQRATGVYTGRLCLPD